MEKEKEESDHALSDRDMRAISKSLRRNLVEVPLLDESSGIAVEDDLSFLCESNDDVPPLQPAQESDAKRPRIEGLFDKPMTTRISQKQQTSEPSKVSFDECVIATEIQTRGLEVNLGVLGNNNTAPIYPLIPDEQCLQEVNVQDSAEKAFDLSEFPWAFDSVGDDLSEVSHNLAIDASVGDTIVPIAEPIYYDDGIEDSTATAPPPKQDTPLYHGAPISVPDSLAAVLSFVQTEHLSGAGLGRLLSLISLHLPTPNNFFESNHNILKHLQNFEDPVFIHYLCSHCSKIRASQNDLCDVCTDEDRTNSYFIQFPLVPQIRELYKRPEFLKDIQYRFKREIESANNIEDIYDGKIFKEAESRKVNPILDTTLMWNWDGLQMFNSIPFSFYPFYLNVNELPPKKRCKSENMLLAGLWGCATKPHPNVFLLPIQQDLKVLKSGVEVDIHGMEEKQVVHVETICGTCDSPAKALIFNQKIHAGFHSCPICLCRGQKPGDSVIFPHEEHEALRNMNDYDQYVKLAVRHRIILNKTSPYEEQCYGIKGPTVLTSIVPDMFSSTAIDSMHCIYLGVMKQMMNFWFHADFKGEPFSLFEKIKIVNHRLKKLKLPQFLQRIPLNVDKFIHWKASELRTFLFYLAAVVLNGLLKEEFFSNFILFMHGTSLLNSSSISEENLQLADRLLRNFHRQFQELYGICNMSFNLHLTLHLVRSVRLLGPLWCCSCFPFEDLNGRLLNFIHGTRHVGLQVYANLSILTKLPLMVNNLSNSHVKDFCKTMTRKYRIKVTEKVSDGLFCVGTFSHISDKTAWVQKDFLSPNCDILLFHRLLKSGQLYVSSMYRQGVRDSSCVRYGIASNFKYGTIQCFVKCLCNCSNHDRYFAVIRHVAVTAVTTAFENERIPMSYFNKCNLVEVSPYELVSLSKLLSVVFKLEVDEDVYISMPLNKFELE